MSLFVMLPVVLAQEAPSADTDGVATSPAVDPGTASAERATNSFGLDAALLVEPLVTDRPDFTESTDAVPWGHLQLEAGYTFTYDREKKDRVRDHTTPELLLRVGVVEDFELRFGWSGYSFTQVNYEGETRGGRSIGREEWEQGGNDLDVGFKLKLAEQESWRPHLAVLGSMAIPSGSADVSSGDVEPLIGLLWAYDLTDDFAVAGQFLLAVPVDEGRRFVQSAASISAAYSLTDRLGTYIEYYGLYPNAHESDGAHTINGGFTYLITRDFQIDIRAGFGLNEEADDFFTGIGFAWRL